MAEVVGEEEEPEVTLRRGRKNSAAVAAASAINAGGGASSGGKGEEEDQYDGSFGLIEEVVNGEPISNLLPSDAPKGPITSNVWTIEQPGGSLVTQTDHEVIELDLKSFLGDPEAYEALCPKCNRCIRRVILRKKQQPPPESPDDDIFICKSCFAFLVVAGHRLVSLCVPAGQPPGPNQWDILKSIVYGGLIESITSLGVVTSAAGASAGTVNILALGLANLISGLFVLGHNLRELKKDRFRGVPNQTNEQVSQYQELLGQRENFIRHAVFAILSYLIFGTVPVVAYVFSFRESNESELKLAVATAASLFCIIMLAIGKAHIQREPKLSTYIKTVLSYGCSGVVASGISYIAGSLILKLVEKLGWFKESETVTLFVPEATLLESA